MACNLIRFYETLGRPLTESNIAWDPLMRCFGEIWKSKKENRKADDPNTLTINKSLPIMKWTEAFQDHLHRCVGARMIPLAYVIWDDEAVPGPCLPLKTDQPFSEKHGSVKEDLVHRASDEHTLNYS